VGKAGLKFGFYYSHALDWEHPDAPGNDWDYQNPGGDKSLFGKDWQTTHPELDARVERYVDGKAIPQLKELIARYHPDIFWFDMPNRMPPYLQLRVLKAVRLADPNVVIDGRGTGWPLANYGDYADTADRPAEVRPTLGDWECIPTCNESYGYHQLDQSYKPVVHFVRLIAKVAAKGGNTLLNIGPMGDGRIDPHSAAILAGIGRWMAVNGDSVHGTTRTPLDRQAWGDSTLKGDTLYLHVFDWPRDGRLVVGGLVGDVSGARLLADATGPTLATERVGDADLLVHVPAAAPDPVDSVIALRLARPPRARPGRLLSGQVAVNQLLAFDGQPSDAAGFTFGDGKTNNYWVAGFTDPKHAMSWDARLDVPVTFDVTVRYSTRAGSDGGTFDLEVGGHTLHGTAAATAGVTDVATADIGTVALPAGPAPVRLTPAAVRRTDLMSLFEVDLTPSR
jgi:alpha-L-fucosidase